MQQKIGQICPGCGAEFQSDQPEQPGYLAPGLQYSHTKNQLVCRSCYRLEHYGEFTVRTNWDDADYRNALRKAVDLADLVLLVIDLIDFEGSWWPALWAELPKDLPVYCIGNKVDLLPKPAILAEIKGWVQNQVSQEGRHPEQVFLVSAKESIGFEKLLAAIPPSVNSIAVIGATNTGKSSVIKTLTQKKGTGRIPTISAFPGTTLGVIPVQFGGADITLLDTPGLIPPGRVSDYYCSNCSGIYIPNKRLNSKLYELVPGQSLALGGVATLTLEKTSSPGSAVVLVYVPEGVVLHRTKSQRLPVIMEQSADWLLPPCSKCSFDDYKHWEYQTVHVKQNQDLAIAGLGWVSLRRTGADFTVAFPPGVRSRTRPALVGPRS